MKLHRRALFTGLATVFLLVATEAGAQTPPASAGLFKRPEVPAAPAALADGESLYRQLGGQAGVQRLVDDFVVKLLADPRMAPFFKDVEQPHFSQQLAKQFCEVSGGPCQLQGKDRDMKKKHEGVDITKSNFNALVEVLQVSMDAQGIAFGTQNRLLAKLAPMHREIVNVK